MAEASELKATLEKLQDVLPDVPTRFEGLVRQAGDIRQKASALLEDVEQADTQAGDLFKEVDAAVKQLLDGVVQNREAIVAGLDQVRQGVGELEEIESAREALKEEADTAGEVLEAFQNRLNEGIEAAKQAGDAFREALDALKEETEAGGQALSSALETADDAADALQQAIGAGKTQVMSTIQDLAAQISHTQQEALSQLESYLSAADDLRETFTSSLNDVMSDLIKDPAEELIEEMTDKITGELKGLVDGAVEEVKDALGALGDSVTGAKDGSSAGREGIKPLFDQVEGFMEPIKTVIDAIRDAASTVGIDF